MKKLFIILLVTFTSCFKEPQQVDQTSNVDIKLALLFEKDGCKVYRFFDGGRAVYYTDCKGKVQYSYNHSDDKTTYRVEVQNETVR